MPRESVHSQYAIVSSQLQLPHISDERLPLNPPLDRWHQVLTGEAFSIGNPDFHKWYGNGRGCDPLDKSLVDETMCAAQIDE